MLHAMRDPRPSLRWPLRGLLALAAALLLCACSDPVETTRRARIQPDPGITVAQALERYPYFTAISWSSYQDKDGKRIVEARCDLDVAATCQGMNESGLRLAARDVARDYFVARFVVEGFPARARALEAQHVTLCSSGARLGFADPKFLRAIYNREQVRFFCLDGLNCPGQNVSVRTSDAPPVGSPAPPAP